MAALEELARPPAPAPLASHWGAPRLLAAAASRDVAELVSGRARAVLVAARPPVGPDGWTTGAAGDLVHLPRATRVADDAWTVSGRAPWVADLDGADLLVVIAADDAGVAAYRVVSGPGTRVEAVLRYDHTTPLGHLILDAAPATRLDLPEDELCRAWSLAQGFAAAEAIGVARACLDMSLVHARERYAFGRPIGSYQAVKHRIVEILRLVENAENCATWFGDAWHADPASAPLAAASARYSADLAQQFATRSNIFVHGGMGATWEHDAPYFYRRAQLRRMLLAGADNAAVEIGAHLLAAAGKEGERD